MGMGSRALYGVGCSTRAHIGTRGVVPMGALPASASASALRDVCYRFSVHTRSVLGALRAFVPGFVVAALCSVACALGFVAGHFRP